jgi:hypothetical protein
LWSSGETTSSINVSTAGTYTVTVTDIANGCTSSANEVIVQNNAIPNISGMLNVCEGATVNLSSNVVGGTWLSFNTSVATINNSGMVMGIAAGTTTIRYTANNGCFSAVTFTVNPLPSISGTNTVSRGNTTQLTSNISTGTWISMNPSIATVTSSGLVSGLSLGQANIVYRTAKACTDTMLVNVIETAAECCDYTIICDGSNVYNGSTYVMKSLTEGYTSAATSTFSITNTNCSHDIQVHIYYSGANVSDFSINDASFQNTIGNGDTYSFSITPNVGLPEGTYQMTIVLSCEADASAITYQKVYDVKFKCRSSCNCRN